MWIGSGGCSNLASTIFSRPALIGVVGLIGQHPRQAAALLGILDRGVGAVGRESRRAGDSDIAACSTKRQSGDAGLAPNWMVAWEAMASGVSGSPRAFR